MINNPCRWWLSNSRIESFTYEGGRFLYHFSPHDNGLSTSMDTNVVFFANNDNHALDVLRRMLEFRLSVIKERLKYDKSKTYKDAVDEMLIERHEYCESRTFKYLQAVVEGKVKLTLAPGNQFFKVGWADNDTILD